MSYAIMLFNGANNHLDSRFNAGNKASLSKPDIAEQVYAFYKKFYSKNKLKIVSICNKDQTEEIKKIIARKGKTSRIKASNPQQKKLFAPQIAHNRLILVSGESRGSFNIKKSFNLTQAEDFAYLNFISSVLDNVLTKVLVEEQGLVDNLYIVTARISGYAELEFGYELTFKAKQLPLERTLNIAIAALNSLCSQLTPLIFTDVKKLEMAKFKLKSKSTDPVSLSTELLANFMDDGFARIGDGYSILSAQFDKKRVIEVFNRLKNAKSVITFIGRIKSTKSKTLAKGEKKGDQAQLEESRKLGNLAGEYSEQDLLLKKRLIKSTYLGEDFDAPHEDQEEDLVELDFFHPMFQVEAGFLELGENYSKIKARWVRYTPNPFKLSKKTLKKASQPPENMVQQISKTSAFFSRLNTKYSLPSVSIFIESFIVAKPTPELNANLEILAMILHARFNALNKMLSALNSGISITAKNGALVIRIHSVADNLKVMLPLVLKKILNGPKDSLKIEKDEKMAALDSAYLAREDKIPLQQYCTKALLRFINQETQLSRSQFMNYLRKIDKNGLVLSDLRIGRVYLEGHVDETVTDLVLKELVLKLDPTYSKTRETNFKLYKGAIDGFKSGKTVVLAVTPPSRDYKNHMYIHTFRTHQKRSNLKFYSTLEVLVSILDPLAFDYLRTTKQLGYVVYMLTSLINDEIFVNLVVQTTNMEQARPEVENFYRLAQKRLKDISEKELKSVVEGKLTAIKSPYPSLFTEVTNNFYQLVEGLEPGYDLQLAQYLEKNGVSKEVLMTAFVDIFGLKAADKIILDTDIYGEANKDSESEKKFVKNEKFDLVLFND